MKTQIKMSMRFVKRVADQIGERFIEPYLELVLFPFMDPSRLGFGWGYYTFYRKRRHKKLDRPLKLCLLSGGESRRDFIDLAVFWINERSRMFQAYKDGNIHEADVIWIYTQDPISAKKMKRLQLDLAKGRPGTSVINHPEHYNFYHEEEAFKMLEAGGVSVPRTSFTEEDLGKTMAVYKKTGLHGAKKFCNVYRGPVAGHRAFQFIDYINPDGYYRRYQAYYILGMVRPGRITLSRSWNSRQRTMERVEHTFMLSDYEVSQVKKIAGIAGFDYFAVCFVRRNPDELPVFLDINIFPNMLAKVSSTRDIGYRGQWHVLDNLERLGLPEPMGKPVWELFDQALLQFVNSSHSDKKKPPVGEADIKLI